MIDLVMRPLAMAVPAAIAAIAIAAVAAADQASVAEATAATHPAMPVLGKRDGCVGVDCRLGGMHGRRGSRRELKGYRSQSDGENG